MKGYPPIEPGEVLWVLGIIAACILVIAWLERITFLTGPY